MTCKVDNETIFDYEEDYTTLCEACNLYCKIPIYRACEIRHQWNLDHGNDIYENIRQIDKIVQAQTGIQISSPTKQIKNSKEQPKKKATRHRGR